MSQNKKNILITTSTFPLHSDDTRPRFISDLSSKLAHKYKVHVICPSELTPQSPVFLDNIEVFRYRYSIKKFQILTGEHGAVLDNLKKFPLTKILIPIFIASQLVYLLSATKKNHYDVVNAHWLLPQGLVAAIAKKIFRIRCKLIVSAHGADLFALKRLDCLKKWILNSADEIIVVSEEMKDYCEKKLRISRNIDVIPMGVDLARTFTPPLTLCTEPKIIYCGRLTEKKGVDILLKALKTVHSEGHPFSCSIIGDGPLRDYLEQLTDDSALTKKVSFYGKMIHSDIAQRLKSHTIFVFPSIEAQNGDREGLGLTAIEAMGCSCIVLASDLETTKDFLTDGQNGFTFTRGDPEALAKKLVFCLENIKKLEDVRINARAHALKNFSWDNTVIRYSSLIDSCLS